ncbi:MAG TPA: V-type ATP synthase subunit F [Clostridiales bacterium]|nr:V-type ATP synthase subunit F [Clostridia bacterium]HCS75611.1 V-type ATP synthase subunit F [Clostridiales bacterium]
MYKIAVMGDQDSIYGFAALGLDIYPINIRNEEGSSEGSKKLRELVNEEYAVIYITEALAETLKENILCYSSTKLPAIIPIPGVSGNTGLGLRMVKRSVEKAVGSDILFRDE